MRRAIFSLASVAALAASAGTASACASGITRSYFSYDRPTATGSSVRLLVRIPAGEANRIGPIRARLVSGMQGRSDDSYVRIRLPEAAVGTNCIYLGPTDGPVFVVGALQRNARGGLYLMAEARRRTRQSPIYPPGRLRPSDYDQYIVDPAYLSPEGRRRREGGE
jgi:hypothetical protein